MAKEMRKAFTRERRRRREGYSNAVCCCFHAAAVSRPAKGLLAVPHVLVPLTQERMVLVLMARIPNPGMWASEPACTRRVCEEPGWEQRRQQSGRGQCAREATGR